MQIINHITDSFIIHCENYENCLITPRIFYVQVYQSYTHCTCINPSWNIFSFKNTPCLCNIIQYHVEYPWPPAALGNWSEPPAGVGYFFQMLRFDIFHHFHMPNDPFHCQLKKTQHQPLVHNNSVHTATVFVLE